MSPYLLVLFIFVCSCQSVYVPNYKLTKVFIMSRHNLRTPLSRDLPNLTPKWWPTFKEGPGILTAKGKVLEGYFGKFLSKWLRDKKLLSEQCPTKDEVYVYTNVIQRTIATGQSFVESAFPDCDVKVHSAETEKDSIFLPAIHNHTEAFKMAVLDLMHKKRNSLQLSEIFSDLNSVLCYNESTNCKLRNQCDLAIDDDKIMLQEDGRPAMIGPMKYGNVVVDAFIMEYFNGFSKKDVAWALMNENRWRSFVTIMRSYHNVLFNMTLIAKDIAKPLIIFMKEKILYDTPKFTLLVGHDSNIYCLLNAMKFKPYTLPDQLEIVPIGGKIVFQKWYDNLKEKYLLKVNYIYQSNKQIRYGLPLTTEEPPQTIDLEMEECKVDSNGYCPWDDFEKFLNKLYG